MKTRLATIEKNLETLRALCAPITLPEDFPPYILRFSVDDAFPEINIYISPEPDRDPRDAILDFFGTTFGRHGWKKDANVYAKHYNWRNDLRGVKVTIFNAEPLPPIPDDIPVAPSEFPLLLTEA